MEETRNQRLSLVIEYFIKSKRVYNQADFSKKTGLAKNFITDMKNGRRAVSDSTIVQITQHFPDISRDWLLTGEGDMLVKKIEDEPLPEAKKINSKHKSIPLIPIDAMAGQLSGEDFQIMEYDCERYSIPDFDAADFLVTVSGDSMTPTFMSGDILAVRKVETSRLWFQWGKPYVIATRQGCIVKRIMPSDKDGFVEIVSDNKEQYPKYDLHSEEIVGIALVIGLVRRL